MQGRISVAWTPLVAPALRHAPSAKPSVSFLISRPPRQLCLFSSATTTPGFHNVTINCAPLSHTLIHPVSRHLRRIVNKSNTRDFSSSASRCNDKPASTTSPTPQTSEEPEKEIRESPYTIPNALTLARILSCPILGYCIVKGEFEWATGILVAGGFSDWLDGWIARRFNMRSVFGTILDPAADKTLMTTLVVTLAWKGLLPMPLAILILGRDVALSLSAFYYRYISLPAPKTFARYWDFSIPSAEVRPTQISKYNTFLQLVLMGATTISPLVTGMDISIPLQTLQWTVAGTTIWSGASYIFAKDAVKILSKK